MPGWDALTICERSQQRVSRQGETTLFVHRPYTYVRPTAGRAGGPGHRQRQRRAGSLPGPPPAVEVTELTTYIVGEQGAETNRPSTPHVEVDSADEEVSAVRVDGQVEQVAEGVVRF